MVLLAFPDKVIHDQHAYIFFKSKVVLVANFCNKTFFTCICIGIVECTYVSLFNDIFARSDVFLSTFKQGEILTQVVLFSLYIIAEMSLTNRNQDFFIYFFDQFTYM